MPSVPAGDRRFDFADAATSHLRTGTPSQPPRHFKFINVGDPQDLREQERVREARGHAVAAALAEKRRKAQAAGLNFRPHTLSVRRRAESSVLPNRTTHQSTQERVSEPTWIRSIGSASIDPFETLVVDASRLTELLHRRSSLSAGEPVFNVNDAIHYNTLDSMFGCGFSDGALTAAIGLTLSYAANGWQASEECIALNCVVVREMRQNLSDISSNSIPATIGAGLLLLGIAYRLGELHSARAHLRGLQTLTSMRLKNNEILTPALRRAIYWQDLFSSIFLDTDRIVSYSDFYPGLHVTMHQMSSGSLPPHGFTKYAHRLGTQFLRIAADVAALYANRQIWIAARDNPARGAMLLDNVQAELEGRIHNLRRAVSDDLQLCCILASQLCVYGFWDGIWNSALIPRELSRMMLHHLRLYCQGQEVEGDEDIFIWLFHVGKAFAIDATVRCGLDELRYRRDCTSGTSDLRPWSHFEGIVTEFIWSEVLYSAHRGWFWERIGL